MKSGNLNFLEPSGPLQACNGTDLPLIFGSLRLFMMTTNLFISDSPLPPPHSGAKASLFTRFLDHTQRRITVGRNPLGDWSARRRDLYVTTHCTHTQTSIRASGGIRTHNLSRGEVADQRLRRRGHSDRQQILLVWSIGEDEEDEVCVCW